MKLETLAQKEEVVCPDLPKRLSDPLYRTKFWSHTCIVHDPKACWRWQGPFGRFIYGVFDNMSARSVAWAAAGGTTFHVPLVLKCVMRDCVRPSHLTAKKLAVREMENEYLRKKYWLKFMGDFEKTVVPRQEPVYVFQNNGLYVPKPGGLDDMAHREGAFHRWWLENKPPFASELPLSDEEALVVKF